MSKKKKGKKHAKRTSKDRNSKVSIPKRKQRRTKSNRTTGKSKKVQRKRVRKPSRKQSVRIDTKYWTERKKTKRGQPRARYSTLTLLARSSKKKFTIKKKIKAIKAEKPSEELVIKIAKSSAKYLKLKKKKSKKNKQVYIKVVVKDYNTGVSRWVSAPRQDANSSIDVEDIYRSILDDVEGYGSDLLIIGTEVEQTIQ